MRPIFCSDQPRGSLFSPSRPSLAYNRPSIARASLANARPSLANARSLNVVNRSSDRESIRPPATNTARTLPAKGIVKPVGATRISSATKKVEFGKSTIVRKDQKRPGTALSKIEEKKPETISERIQKVEQSLKSALEQAESQLTMLTSELEFSQELLDEATEYCDRLDTYKELFKYYEEIKHLSEKLKDKRRSLQYSKEEYLKNVHDYSHFLSDSLSSFRDFMDLRKKKIDENIELANAAEEEEKENMRQNPLLYKRDVEMKEQAIQVRRESLIYYSPNAGVLRSTARQRVEMPALPVLKTDFDVSMTPTYSAYPTSARRRNEMPAPPVLKTNFEMNITPTYSARKRNEKMN